MRDLDIPYLGLSSGGKEFLKHFAQNHVDLSPGGQGYSELRRSLDKPLHFLAVMVLLVLFITVVNISNLQIARATAKRREIAVRLAIGAGKATLFRQALLESILLALLGGVPGVLLAYVATPVLLRLLSSDLTEVSASMHPDAVTLAALLMLTLGAGIAFGLLPALQSTRVDINESLKAEGSYGSTGGRLCFAKRLPAHRSAYRSCSSARRSCSCKVCAICTMSKSASTPGF